MGRQLIQAIRRGLLGSILALGCLTLGCASSQNRAPVESRGSLTHKPAVINNGVARPSSGTALPGAENAGKSGYYSVKTGDTLLSIGLETGQHWKDLVMWNNIDNPNIIEVGQVLRVEPPGANPSPVVSAKVETRPLIRARQSAAAAASAAASGPTVSVDLPAPERIGDENVDWMWPAQGPLIVEFDETRSKGLVVGGQAGDPVVAAADGRVVYAGSGLRGYGNLLILKHNNTYLTAYAHNKTLLVKEDQVVRRGQLIAEMGSTDAERVQLHFEIRRLGKPVNPATLLPPR